MHPDESGIKYSFYYNCNFYIKFSKRTGLLVVLEYHICSDEQVVKKNYIILREPNKNQLALHQRDTI